MRRVLVSVFLALAVVVTGGGFPAARALAGSVPLSIKLHPTCDRSWGWVGDNAYGSYESTWWVSGNFDYCIWLYQLGTSYNGVVDEGDPYHDYFYLDNIITWRNATMITGNSSAWMTVSVSNATIQDWDASATDGSSGGCNSAPISLSVGAYGFGVSVTPIVCSGDYLKLDWVNATGARWSTPDVMNTPRWDTGYLVQVPQGAKPHFSAVLYYPNYKHPYYRTLCGGGICKATYTKTPAWSYDPWYAMNVP